MEVCKRFSDESPAQWLSDLAWVSDDEKVRALLLDIFSRRKRCSGLQARMWGRIVELYWRVGLTTDEIAHSFGVGTQNISRVIKSVRREAKDFFDVYRQPIVRAKARKPAKPSATPITADPANESPEHWSAVLASHGLYEPDKRVKGWRWQNPTYNFSWPVMQSSDEKEAAWGFTFAWAEFFESFQASTEDPERFKGFVAHTITASDVDRAVDRDPEARDYLRQYGQLESKKFTIVPGIDDPCEGRPFMQQLSAPKASNDVYIAEDGSVYERGSNKLCGHIERQDRPRNKFDAQLFFTTYKLTNISVTRKESNTDSMDYKSAAEIIKQYDIPRTTVARICRMHLPDLSGYLNGRLDLPQEKVERIAQTVADIVRVIEAIRHKVDLRDPVNVQKLIVAVNDAGAQRDLFPLPASSASSAATASAD
jgi:hypothetical protein